MINDLKDDLEYASILSDYWTLDTIAIIQKHHLKFKVIGEYDFNKCVEELQENIPQLVVSTKDIAACVKCSKTSVCENTTTPIFCKSVDTVLRNMLDTFTDSDEKSEVSTYYRSKNNEQ